MSEPRSDSLFHSYYRSSEQFDYFMLGLTGAIVAYMSSDLPVSRLTSPSYDIYLLAVLALLSAVYSGFRRIEVGNVCKRLNATALHLAEKRGKLKEALNKVKPGASVINAGTGETHTEKQMLEMIDEISRSLPKGEQVLKEQQARSLRYYKMRNRLFFVGVIGVFVGKVASPYLG